MHEVTFSVFTKPWPNLSIAELGAFVSGLGFRAIELPVRPGFQVEPENVERDLPKAAHQLQKDNLTIASVAGPVTEEAFAACAEAGIPVIRVMFTVDDDGYMATERRVRAELDQLVHLSEKYGVTVGVQNHCNFFVPSNSMGLLHLIESYDPKHIAAIWDVAHNALDGEEPEMGLDIVWSHLCMVNLKNAYWHRTNGPEAQTAEWRIHWTSGRQGLASWPRTATYLKKRRYSGIICLTAEYSATTTDVDRLTQEDLIYAKSLFDEQVE